MYENREEICTVYNLNPEGWWDLSDGATEDIRDMPNPNGDIEKVVMFDKKETLVDYWVTHCHKCVTEIQPDQLILLTEKHWVLPCYSCGHFIWNTHEPPASEDEEVDA